MGHRVLLSDLQEASKALNSSPGWKNDDPIWMMVKTEDGPMNVKIKPLSGRILEKRWWNDE
jgi:hypothetical protein